MAGRPVDHRRRRELLDAAIDHAVAVGFAELSWRSVAVALGVSTTTLVHHFGTKEALLSAILAGLAERMATLTDAAAGEHPDLATAARAVWSASSDPANGPTFRLFFAVYGHALQAPETFAEFLAGVGVRVHASLCAAQSPDVDPTTASRRATLVIATLRGLLLDLLAHEDRERVEAAAGEFLATLAG